MQHIAQVSQHIFNHSPLDGLFDDIEHIFDDHHGNDPLAALHEVAHHTKTDDSGQMLKHEHFLSHPEGHEPMMAIMDMMRQMARPLLADRPTPFNPGPPRGLVALACHRDAITFCRRFCSCWEGMTKCLAEHTDQIQPRCSHLLEASGIISKEEPAEPQSPVRAVERAVGEANEDEAKEDEEEQDEEEQASEETDKEEKQVNQHPLLTGQLPPLTMQATLQKMHDGLVTDMKATRAAVKRDAEDPLPAAPTAEFGAPEEAPEEGDDMTEDTPAWITGDIEAPKGEKDMGGWTMRVYTEEQQSRLNIDEEGRAVSKAALKPTPKELSAVPPIPSQAAVSTSPWIEQAKEHLHRTPVWMVGALVASLIMALLICAASVARSRRNAALGGTYARITLDHAESKATLMHSRASSNDQV